MIERFISYLKKDANYKFEVELSFYQSYLVVYHRLIQVFRGFLSKLSISYRGLFFRGSRVKIMFASQLKMGRNCIIENDTLVNALSQNGIILENNVTIAKGSTLICTGVVKNKGMGINIGSNSAVGANSYIGGQGGVKIGRNVIMGPGVQIFSENHNYNLVDIPIRLQGENRKGVVINDNCWIGACSIILDGVELKEGTVVAAGSVVTKSILDTNMIVAGIPAKIVRSRLS